MRRILPLATAAAGVIAIAAALVLRFVVVPGQAQLPADTDEVRTYTGTVDAMLNADALATGDLSSLLLTDVPATFTRHVEVIDVDGGDAEVVETATITLPDGTELVRTETPYTLDRKTMVSFGDTTGLVIGWPIGTEARDHVGWSDDLQATVDLVHERSEEHAGIDTEVFTSDARGEITDPSVLGLLPASLPKALLPAIAEVLALPDALAAQLPALMAALPDEVPLTYGLDSQTTYWVDPATGIVVDVDRNERRTVALDVPGVPALPLADVFSISYVGEEASVAATVADARDKGDDLRWYGTTLPAGLTILGLLAVAGGLVWARRERATLIDLTGEDTEAPADRPRIRI